MTPHFIAHPVHGIAPMTPRTHVKLRLEHHCRVQRVSLAEVLPRHALVVARYLPDDDADMGAR